MLPAEVISRARSQLGMKTRYESGRGGFFPGSLTAADAMGRCCCSGFVAWCLNTPRRVDLPMYQAELGSWVETSAIVRDARRPFGMFQQVPIEDAEPGMVLCYGDRPGHQGHVGIITVAGPPLLVIHCSSSNYVRTGDAIQETGPELFIARHAICARCAHVDYANYQEPAHAA
jgi:hypothetical protein